MPIDASIPMGVRPPQIESPLNALAQMMQVKGLQQQGEMNGLKMDEYRRGIADQDSLRSALSAPGADPYQVLLRSGNVKGATDYQKSQADTAKTSSETDYKKLETAHKRVDLIGQTMGWVKANPTVENATQAVQYLVQNGVMPPEKAQEALAKFNANPTPQGVAQFAELGYRAALSAKDQLPKIDTRNLGGTTDTLSTDPVNGRSSVVNSAQNTQSPDNAASNARIAADAAAGRAVTARGQDMTDQRQRDALAATITKPFEITGEDGKPVLVQQDKQGNIKPVQGYGPKQGASKPLTDTQAKALQFGSRMQSAEDTLAELSGKGVTTSIPGSRGGYGVGTAINALQPADRQRLDQAKRDFINAVLRRESGAAISPTEFDSAEKQYFPQPGETDPSILSQKKKNRELATRGILAEVPDSENRVAKVRGPASAPTVNIDSLLDKYK